jgi:small subunit ribosomal protein S5
MDKENTKKEEIKSKDIEKKDVSPKGKDALKVSPATENKISPSGAPKPQGAKQGTVYAKKRFEKNKGRRNNKRSERQSDEFDQKLVDIARVTRVMAGGKRMRFRACVVIGDKKGKVAFGIDKGADVTIAVNKAVNMAKKNLIEVPIVNDTIPHAIYQKQGAAKILLKPARRGKGVIAGGAARVVLEMAGIKNVTSKILGTNNKVNIVRSVIEALDNLKKVEGKKNPPALKATEGKEKKQESKKS